MEKVKKKRGQVRERRKKNWERRRGEEEEKERAKTARRVLELDQETG